MHVTQLSSQSLLCTLHWAPQSPLTFQTYCLLCVVSALQRSAMKLYTCAIMTPESLGDEFTSATWNSAHVRQGKSSVKESATQVRCQLLFFFFSRVLFFCTKNDLYSQQALHVSFRSSHIMIYKTEKNTAFFVSELFHVSTPPPPPP